MVRSGQWAGVLPVAAMTLLAGGALAQTLETASGVSIDAPPPETMDCAQLSNALTAIDASGYRSGSAPDDQADRTILAYETDVSEEFYWRCAQADVEPSPEGGFSGLAAE